jgi:hypothetical protein
MIDVTAFEAIRTTTEGHVLRIEVDSVAKKNAFMQAMEQK